MFDQIRETVEDVAVGVIMTTEVFRNFDKSWITVILGAVYIGYKIYTQHLKAKMFNTQLKAWEDTKTKIEDDLTKNSQSQSKRHG